MGRYNRWGTTRIYLLFNIFIADLFLVTDDIDWQSYTDDNTIYCSNDCVNDVVGSLSGSAKKNFQWFSENQIKGNTDQSHLILNKESDAETCASESLIKNTTCEKLLGVKID